MKHAFMQIFHVRYFSYAHVTAVWCFLFERYYLIFNNFIYFIWDVENMGEETNEFCTKIGRQKNVIGSLVLIFLFVSSFLYQFNQKLSI